LSSKMKKPIKIELKLEEIENLIDNTPNLTMGVMDGKVLAHPPQKKRGFWSKKPISGIQSSEF